MLTRVLNEVIQFTIGKNPTRLKESDIDLYTPEDFEKDLHSINATEKEDSCVINLIRSKAAPCSLQTTDKCITSNFIRCEFDKDILDSWYFCYQFNAGKTLEQQIAMYHQGTTLSVKKLNIKIIGELKIPIPDIQKQRLIGRLYRQSIIQNDLRIKQAEDINTLTLSVIRRIEED